MCVHDDLEFGGEALVHVRVQSCLRFVLEASVHVDVRDDLEFGGEAMVHVLVRSCLRFVLEASVHVYVRDDLELVARRWCTFGEPARTRLVRCRPCA